MKPPGVQRHFSFSFPMWGKLFSCIPAEICYTKEVDKKADIPIEWDILRNRRRWYERADFPFSCRNIRFRLGGISVLREAVKQLPHENFIYFGDSYHAPYGIKSHDQVLQLSKKALRHLLRQGVKAVVIACNTATGAAAKTLRTLYPELPIIGIDQLLTGGIAPPGGRVVVWPLPGH